MRGKKSETLDRVDNRVQQIDGEGHKGKRVPFCIARHPIANNIAEGNGKRSLPDRCRYLDIARGSALECAACLDGLVARRKLSADQVAPGKHALVRIVSMLTKMLKRFLGVKALG